VDIKKLAATAIDNNKDLLALKAEGATSKMSSAQLDDLIKKHKIIQNILVTRIGTNGGTYSSSQELYPKLPEALTDKLIGLVANAHDIGKRPTKESLNMPDKLVQEVLKNLSEKDKHSLLSGYVFNTKGNIMYQISEVQKGLELRCYNDMKTLAGKVKGAGKTEWKLVNEGLRSKNLENYIIALNNFTNRGSTPGRK
jgi:hypothetical protein